MSQGPAIAQGLPLRPADEPSSDPAVNVSQAPPAASDRPTSASSSDATSTSSPKPAKPKKKTPPVFPSPKSLPSTGPFKILFFENDFSSKGQPGSDFILGENLKLMPLEFLDAEAVFSTGGEVRFRYMNQNNRLQVGGPAHDTYNLWRWRQYFDLKAGDNLRFYAETIQADCFGEDLPIQAIDENQLDLLNAFVDLEVFETETGGTHTLRVGRQELLFGRQRLVSALDWANIRRNFEGFRYMIREEDYKLDLFTVNPVNSATGFNSVLTHSRNFDRANRNVFFSGAYFSYTGVENTNLDLYYLWLDDKIQIPNRADGHRHTIGSRYSRLIPDEGGRVWDIDVEGGFQFGSDEGKKVIAGFATGILGHTWKDAPWTPRISGLFYFGSGDLNPNDNQDNTFDTLFPLGHAYWALSDNLCGQNLLDYCLQADVKPTAKTGLTSAYHVFNLASSGDRVYNVAGVPFGSPGHGTDVGTALDLYGYYAFNANFDVQTGYSWFWYGEFIDQTVPRNHASQFYLQTSIRY